MNTKNILIGSTVIASLFGLGLLARHFLKDPELEEEALAEETNKDDKILKTTSPADSAAKPKSKTSASPTKTTVLKTAPPPVPKEKRGKRPVERSVVQHEKPIGISLRGPLPELSPIRRPVRPTTPPVRVSKKATSAPALKVDDAFPLKKGSKGPKVERLNVWLTRNHSWTGPITDEFDDHTERKLKRLIRKPELDERTFQRMRMDRPVFEQKIIR